MLAFDAEVASFLRQTLVAVLGTTNRTGTPHMIPIWFTWEDGAAYMFTSRTSAKWRNIQVQPYASLCVDRRDLPYAAVILSGPITEVDRPVFEIISSMALRYLGDKEGQEFADMYKDNPPSSVAFRLTPDRVVRNLNP